MQLSLSPTAGSRCLQVLGAKAFRGFSSVEVGGVGGFRVIRCFSGRGGRKEGGLDGGFDVLGDVFTGTIR